MADVGIVVKVEECSDLDELATAFDNKGLHVEKKWPKFRTIVGTGDSSLVKELMSMVGVESVRPEDKFQLPPMSEEIPQ